MMTQQQIVGMLTVKIEKWSRHGLSQADLASKLGVTDAFLSMVLNGHKKPSKRILRFLRVRKVVGYDYSMVSRQSRLDNTTTVEYCPLTMKSLTTSEFAKRLKVSRQRVLFLVMQDRIRPRPRSVLFGAQWQYRYEPDARVNSATKKR